jgi:hypothetical protein
MPSSTTTPTCSGRRLPDGRHQPRGLRAGRRLEAEQAGRRLRRQRHLDRRPGHALVHRRHAGRFKAYGWNVVGPVDGHDVEAVDRAIAEARRSAEKPTLIIAKTHIGKGSPNRANTAKAHGEPLGADEIKLTRTALGWKHEPFELPKAVYDEWTRAPRATRWSPSGNQRFAAYRAEHPELAAEFTRRMKRRAAEELRAGRGRRRHRPPMPRPKPSPRARPRRSRWKPSPPRCPNCWAARPT